jgi:hypothetical protein
LSEQAEFDGNGNENYENEVETSQSAESSDQHQQRNYYNNHYKELDEELMVKEDNDEENEEDSKNELFDVKDIDDDERIEFQAEHNSCYDETRALVIPPPPDISSSLKKRSGLDSCVNNEFYSEYRQVILFSIIFLFIFYFYLLYFLFQQTEQGLEVLSKD